MSLWPWGKTNKRYAVLDHEQYARNKRIFRRNPIHIACRTYALSQIIDQIMPEIWKNGKQQVIKEDDPFFITFKEHWMKLPKYIFSEIFNLGVLPVRIVKLRKYADPVPIILHDGLGIYYDVEVSTNIKESEIEYTVLKLMDGSGSVFPTKSRMVDKKAFVIDEFDKSPDEFGNLNCNMASLMLELDFFIRERANILQSDHIASRPPYICERKKPAANASSNANMISPTGKGLPPPIPGSDFTPSHYVGDEDSPDDALKLAETQRVAAAMSNYRKDANQLVLQHPFFPDNFVTMKEEFSATSGIVPRPIQNWDQLNELLEQRICSIYGLHRAMIYSVGTQHNRSTQDAEAEVQRSLLIAINTMRKYIELVMNICYQKIYNEPEITIKIPLKPVDNYEAIKKKFNDGAVNYNAIESVLNGEYYSDQQINRKPKPPATPLAEVPIEAEGEVKPKKPKKDKKRKREEEK